MTATSAQTTAIPTAPAAPDLGSPELNAAMTAGLQNAETVLHRQLAQGEDFLVDKISHLAVAGGKRFRVMFALLAGMYGPRSMSDDVVNASVVVELTHLATLYHDDVMDEADRRRGAESANARWNNSVAILAGDYLFAVASDMMAELGTGTVKHFAATFRELVTGQMRETVGCEPGGDEIEHYMKVIQEKTGVLIASAGYLGSMHAGAPDEVRDALFRFGRHMGQVFQIVDDIIDIWSDPKDSGKVPGTDLREGVWTLPVLYALREDGAAGDRLREILTGPVAEDALVDEALSLIRASEGREKAEADVERYRQLAEEELDALPAGEVTDALRALLTLSLKRLG
ncbi:polyprenyl synthetase family protein [Corynebacterium sp. 320]|uniref:polyprenyl synthetase family protein n=1 Tax=Corynebacterium TaxID=1716 RepID=UPI00125CAEEA|nr:MULTISPECIES: polyprenyl synthetase family protein [Corynebacterium]KAB1504590.1 polyprenyl synthetase family protein [Corynebacterium sp. 320]KAB1553349.1 polyprenyl synthetase family protein [Corynebacterium sp. 321]KAB1554538.1 polyprenyl synthetase family protein [Corynebacterium sp. 319]KAB3528726.1 polyprenyl synthetase family protein [Corynebacterium sp. 250]KAB3540840.1 polyprenyl synthetase family protein [Corynebacterium sp. 366]